MRILTFLLFSLFFKTDNFRVIDKQVNENRASFQYHSEIIVENENTKEQSKSYRVFNFLKNNDRINPLSIEWGAANLSYIVSNQLTYNDKAPSISDAREIRDPLEYPNTPIIYGNGGRHSYPASCYIERSKAPQFTSFRNQQTLQHRDENGTVIGQIGIVATYNEDLGASIISFEVKGGADIVFKQPKGSFFNKHVAGTNKPDLDTWLIRRDTSLANLLDLKPSTKKDNYAQLLVNWLNPFNNAANSISEYVLCKNNSINSSQLKLYCAGSNFDVSSVRFLAVNSLQRVGVLGFASNILTVK